MLLISGAMGSANATCCHSQDDEYEKVEYETLHAQAFDERDQFSPFEEQEIKDVPCQISDHPKDLRESLSCNKCTSSVDSFDTIDTDCSFSERIGGHLAEVDLGTPNTEPAHRNEAEKARDVAKLRSVSKGLTCLLEKEDKKLLKNKTSTSSVPAVIRRISGLLFGHDDTSEHPLLRDRRQDKQHGQQQQGQPQFVIATLEDQAQKQGNAQIPGMAQNQAMAVPVAVAPRASPRVHHGLTRSDTSHLQLMSLPAQHQAKILRAAAYA